MTAVSEERFFTPEQLDMINVKDLPKHIAFIPDGNRRWAKLHRFDTERGHQTGADNLMEIVKAAKELGVPVVTFYLFSTENWTRPKREVDTLMWMLRKYLVKERENLIRNGVKLETIGDLNAFPKNVIHELDLTLEATKDCQDITVVFALNYGARDEIRRAVERIQKLEPSDIKISEELISKHMDTAKWPDPDLLIRTSGEMRISNFLLWQISYAELHVTETLWPDFTQNHLLEAIYSYQQRERRLGV